VGVKREQLTQLQTQKITWGKLQKNYKKQLGEKKFNPGVTPGR
jgi:hypothetical protein